jgi:DNA-binding HxlR family transcriptional regulator
VLTATLRGLEEDGLVWRRAEPTVPPVVTYGLTARGAALAPVFDAMAAWGMADGPAPEVPSRAEPEVGTSTDG